MPSGAYIPREPLAELVEMVGPDRVIPVVVDGASTREVSVER